MSIQELRERARCGQISTVRAVTAALAEIAELEAQVAETRKDAERFHTLHIADRREIEMYKRDRAELEARVEAAEKERDALTFAAHKPDDYRFGVASWINQRLYRTYIEQGKNQAEWDALTAAHNARDKAEARAEAAEKDLHLARLRIAKLETWRKQERRHTEAAEAEAARLRAALEQVEWRASGCHLQCLWCHGIKEFEGHRPNCQRQAALRPEQPAESDAINQNPPNV